MLDLALDHLEVQSQYQDHVDLVPHLMKLKYSTTSYHYLQMEMKESLYLPFRMVVEIVLELSMAEGVRIHMPWRHGLQHLSL